MELIIVLLVAAFVAITLTFFIKRRKVKKVESKIPSFNQEDLEPKPNTPLEEEEAK